MTGEQLYPLGDLMFEDLVDVYKEQGENYCRRPEQIFLWLKR